MIEDSDTRAVVDFVTQHNGYGIDSTGANKVSYSAPLYNVVGSTADPKRVPGYYGLQWKGLLIKHGIDSDCYVTKPAGLDSHPEFSVGGHMTPDRNGRVIAGGTCYLMPECNWHNNSKRNGEPMEHTKTMMLQLTGYFENELAATFQLRLPSDEPYALLYRANGGWAYRDLSAAETDSLRAQPSQTAPGYDYYVLFERVRGEKTLHYIRKYYLPGAVEPGNGV